MGASTKCKSYDARCNFRRAPAILLAKEDADWYLPCKHNMRGNEEDEEAPALLPSSFLSLLLDGMDDTDDGDDDGDDNAIASVR